jgi:excisionase family DNA binding protein
MVTKKKNKNTVEVRSAADLGATDRKPTIRRNGKPTNAEVAPCPTSPSPAWPDLADRRRTVQSLPWEPAWLSVEQVCNRWQLDRKTVYKFIDARVLPAWKVSRHLYRIALADVVNFESRNRAGLRGNPRR